MPLLALLTGTDNGTVGVHGHQYVERRVARHKELGTEIQLAFHADMHHGLVELPVIGQRMVGGGVLLMPFLALLTSTEKGTDAIAGPSHKH